MVGWMDFWVESGIDRERQVAQDVFIFGDFHFPCYSFSIKNYAKSKLSDEAPYNHDNNENGNDYEGMIVGVLIVMVTLLIIE